MTKHVHGGNIYTYKNCLDFSANCNPLGTPESVKQSDILYQNELTYEQAKKEMVEILMKGIKAGGKSKDSGN